VVEQQCQLEVEVEKEAMDAVHQGEVTVE